jgi:hypothetical protein
MTERFVRSRFGPVRKFEQGSSRKPGEAGAGGSERCVETAARREKTNCDALKEHVRIILDSHICPVYHREGAANAA